MTVRIYSPWDDDPVYRCMVGRHRVKQPLDIMFIVDGKALCQKHAIEICGAMDSFYKSSVSRTQIIAAYRSAADETANRKRDDRMRKIAGTLEPGFVYYIRMDDLIKIGYAKDVTKRMRAYPPSAELLAVHPGTPLVEKQMHDQFHAFLRRGREWFAPHQQVMDHISEVREKFGDPSPFAYTYTKSKTA